MYSVAGSWRKSILQVRFLRRARKLLVQRRVLGAWDDPIGLLTHHLDHDKATWLFLERFLATFREATIVSPTGTPVQY